MSRNTRIWLGLALAMVVTVSGYFTFIGVDNIDLETQAEIAMIASIVFVTSMFGLLTVASGMIKASKADTVIEWEETRKRGKWNFVWRLILKWLAWIVCGFLISILLTLSRGIGSVTDEIKIYFILLVIILGTFVALGIAMWNHNEQAYDASGPEKTNDNMTGHSD